MRLDDLVEDKCWFCSEQTTCQEAAELMIQRSLSVLPVLDSQGKLVGIVTPDDVDGENRRSIIRGVCRREFPMIDRSSNIERLRQVCQSDSTEPFVALVDRFGRLYGLINLDRARRVLRSPAGRDL
jgi:CBS-domain-containing membrane protein